MTMLNRNSQAERTHVLILGAPRSGTSILASLVGAHPDIAMCSEDYSNAWTAIIGKPVVGNKLCVPRQLHPFIKNNYFIKFIKRVGLGKFLPLSEYAIRDYLNLPNLKILYIVRDQKKADSIARRRRIKRYFLFFSWKRILRKKEIKKHSIMPLPSGKNLNPMKMR